MHARAEAGSAIDALDVLAHDLGAGDIVEYRISEQLDVLVRRIRAEFRAAVEAEREACIRAAQKLADRYKYRVQLAMLNREPYLDDEIRGQATQEAADAIRARGGA